MPVRDLKTDSVILIVDDDAGIRRMLERVLGSAGYNRVHAIADPAELPTQVRALSADLIVLDLHMPNIDGFDVLRALRSEVGAEEYLPVLMITGDLSRASRNQALSMGAKDFLTKPFDPDEALLRISNLLLTRMLYCEMSDHQRVLEQKVAARTRALEAAQIEILERLALVSEFHDEQTGQHIRRVGTLAALLARTLHLPEPEVELIRRAALLHDVGKVAIPPDVAQKRGRLTPSEFQCMAKHTTIGARLLSNSRFRVLRKAEEIALRHHEWFDGTGYPEGLAGDAIPIAGRIVAVADAFDALTHERPYKGAWSVQDALLEIRRETGTHFDPVVVDALLALHGEGVLAALDEPLSDARAQAQNRSEHGALAALVAAP
ncbi:MAG: HD-GYP domain-containing protein [Longimicrobiales bacterium]